MKQKDVQVGKTYAMNHTSGRGIHVRIKSVVVRGGYSPSSVARTHWLATNLLTGREIEVKSAKKLLWEVVPGE